MILPGCESGTQQSTVNKMYEKVKQIIWKHSKASQKELMLGHCGGSKVVWDLLIKLLETSVIV